MSDIPAPRCVTSDLRSPVGRQLLRTLDATATPESQTSTSAVTVLGFLLATPLLVFIVVQRGGWSMLQSGAHAVWGVL